MNDEENNPHQLLLIVLLLQIENWNENELYFTSSEGYFEEGLRLIQLIFLCGRSSGDWASQNRNKAPLHTLDMDNDIEILVKTCYTVNSPLCVSVCWEAQQGSTLSPTGASATRFHPQGGLNDENFLWWFKWWKLFYGGLNDENFLWWYKWWKLLMVV